MTVLKNMFLVCLLFYGCKTKDEKNPKLASPPLPEPSLPTPDGKKPEKTTLPSPLQDSASPPSQDLGLKIDSLKQEIDKLNENQKKLEEEVQLVVKQKDEQTEEIAKQKKELIEKIEAQQKKISQLQKDFTKSFTNRKKTDSEIDKTLATERKQTDELIINLSSSCKVVLFTSDGQRASDYYQSIDKFKTKDLMPCELHFSKSTFIVKNLLSKDGASLIFKTIDDQVLRIPVYKDKENDLQDFMTIYKILHEKNAPVVPTIASDDTHVVEYLLHDFLDIKFTLMDFVKEFEKNPTKYSDEAKNFFDFCAAISDFEFIADFHDKNIVMTQNKEWLITDMGDSNSHGERAFKGATHELFKPTNMKNAIANIDSFDTFLTTLKVENKLKFSENPITQPMDPYRHDGKNTPRIYLPNEWAQIIDNRVLRRRFSKIKAAELKLPLPSSEEGDLESEGFKLEKLSDSSIAYELIILNINPNLFDIKIAHTDDWGHPKTTKQYVADAHAWGGMNGGYWGYADTGAKWMLIKVLERGLGYSSFTIPSAILKTPEHLLMDSNNFWAAVAWSIKDTKKILSNYVKVQWRLKYDKSEIPVERLQYDYKSKTQTLFWGSGNHYTQYDIAEGTIKNVTTTTANSGAKGTSFTLDASSKVELKVNQHVEIIPYFLTPNSKGEHDFPDDSHSKEWENMDYILNGKSLLLNGDLSDLTREKPVISKDTNTRSAVCIRGPGEWAFILAKKINAIDLSKALFKLGCEDALLLDGGSSSSLFADKYFQEGGDRALSDSLIFIKKP